MKQFLLLVLVFLMGCASAQPGSLEYIEQQQRYEAEMICRAAYREYRDKTGWERIYPRAGDYCPEYARQVVK